MTGNPQDSSPMHFLVINGPNLNLLGTREPEIYGSATLTDLEQEWEQRATRYGASIDAFQSNHEGTIVDAIQEAAGSTDGIVLNAGALTHTSRSIPDAITATGIPLVEVHISNIHEREPWRVSSFISPVARHVIYGRGTDGYLHAIDHLAASLTSPPITIHYGEHADQFFDLRVPDPGDSSPVVVFIHGGFWRELWQRDTIEQMAVDLADAAATVNIEYRRGVGSFPASVQDVHGAIDKVKVAAQDHGLDSDRVVVVGHSAGGYLALKLAEERDDIAHVVAIAPAANLDSVATQYGDGNPASLYLGGDPGQQPAAWDAGRLTRNPRVPVTIVHGTKDESVPPAHADWYADPSSSKVDVEILDGAGHFDLVDPVSDYFATVRSTILEAAGVT